MSRFFCLDTVGHHKQLLDVRMVCGWHKNKQQWAVKKLRIMRIHSEPIVPEELFYPAFLLLRDIMNLKDTLKLLQSLMSENKEAEVITFREKELFHNPLAFGVPSFFHHSGYSKQDLGTSTLPIWKITGYWRNVNPGEFTSYIEPLISSENAPYFPRLVDGEAWYLYNKAWTQPGELNDTVDISITDDRAYFAGVNIEGDTYTIQCKGKELAQATLHLYTSTVQLEQKKAEIINTFVIQGQPDRITLVLISAGEWLDRREVILYSGNYQAADDVQFTRDDVLTIKELLARRGESTVLEFKERIDGGNHRFLKTIVAFANTQGGTILLGVNDEGHVTGLVESDTKQRVINLIEGNIERSLEVMVTPEEFEGKQILIIHVPEGPNKPYALLLNSNDPRYYIRRDGSNKMIHPDEMEQLQHSKVQISPWHLDPFLGYR